MPHSHFPLLGTRWHTPGRRLPQALHTGLFHRTLNCLGKYHRSPNHLCRLGNKFREMKKLEQDQNDYKSTPTLHHHHPRPCPVSILLQAHSQQEAEFTSPHPDPCWPHHWPWSRKQGRRDTVSVPSVDLKRLCTLPLPLLEHSHHHHWNQHGPACRAVRHVVRGTCLSHPAPPGGQTADHQN